VSRPENHSSQASGRTGTNATADTVDGSRGIGPAWHRRQQCWDEWWCQFPEARDAACALTSAYRNSTINRTLVLWRNRNGKQQWLGQKVV
jgi:hypothetical protein